MFNYFSHQSLGTTNARTILIVSCFITSEKVSKYSTLSILVYRFATTWALYLSKMPQGLVLDLNSHIHWIYFVSSSLGTSSQVLLSIKSLFSACIASFYSRIVKVWWKELGSDKGIWEGWNTFVCVF